MYQTEEAAARADRMVACWPPGESRAAGGPCREATARVDLRAVRGRPDYGGVRQTHGQLLAPVCISTRPPNGAARAAWEDIEAVDALERQSSSSGCAAVALLCRVQLRENLEAAFFSWQRDAAASRRKRLAKQAEKAKADQARSELARWHLLETTAAGWLALQALLMRMLLRHWTDIARSQRSERSTAGPRRGSVEAAVETWLCAAATARASAAFRCWRALAREGAVRRKTERVEAHLSRLQAEQRAAAHMFAASQSRAFNALTLARALRAWLDWRERGCGRSMSFAGELNEACQNCGNILDEDANFCRKCGQRRRGYAEVETAASSHQKMRLSAAPAAVPGWSLEKVVAGCVQELEQSGWQKDASRGQGRQPQRTAAAFAEAASSRPDAAAVPGASAAARDFLKRFGAAASTEHSGASLAGRHEVMPTWSPQFGFRSPS
eukprot:TRINITY_DN51196_c0_g1_i1.p1 TRINITY_DN51196_c0_g1~~TRINITY_DN51196_c0_g1_i1.p1  ORF type:complete len:440 (-),score=98.38 TRINITY_DN51196_c0_g1_i1:32-1351(-)